MHMQGGMEVEDPPKARIFGWLLLRQRPMNSAF